MLHEIKKENSQSRKGQSIFIFRVPVVPCTTSAACFILNLFTCVGVVKVTALSLQKHEHSTWTEQLCGCNEQRKRTAVGSPLPRQQKYKYAPFPHETPTHTSNEVKLKRLTWLGFPIPVLSNGISQKRPRSPLKYNRGAQVQDRARLWMFGEEFECQVRIYMAQQLCMPFCAEESAVFIDFRNVGLGTSRASRYNINLTVLHRPMPWDELSLPRIPYMW